MAARKKTTKKTAEQKQQEEMTLQDLLDSKGFEGATAQSFAMPFLRILQKLSPECDSDDPAYIEGAEAGLILHTITKDLYEEVNVVPLQYRDTYIEWIPREKGGGFVQEHPFPDIRTSEILSTCSKEENKNILPNGNEFKLHSNYFCALEIDDGEWEPVMISMSSSQLKTSRLWLSTMVKMKIEHEGQTYAAKNIRSFQWALGTERLENDKGVWYGWTFDAGDNTLMLPQLAEQQESVRTAIKDNLLTYDRSQQQTGASEMSDSENAL